MPTAAPAATTAAAATISDTRVRGLTGATVAGMRGGLP